MASAHPLDHACSNCFYWSPNKEHPKSSMYSGSVCLEREGAGYTYPTAPPESCSQFRRIADEPISGSADAAALSLINPSPTPSN
jgi:hypothetical protein